MCDVDLRSHPRHIGPVIINYNSLSPLGFVEVKSEHQHEDTLISTFCYHSSNRKVVYGFSKIIPDKIIFVLTSRLCKIFIPWMAQSPHLTPIEHLWNIIEWQVIHLKRVAGKFRARSRMDFFFCHLVRFVNAGLTINFPLSVRAFAVLGLHV